MPEYNNTIDKHKQSLELTRNMIVSLISRLDDTMNENSFDERIEEEWKLVWGEKESVVSVLVKLTGLLVKVVPMERQLLDSERTETSVNNSNVGRIINSDDKEIIKRYIKKLNKSS